MRLGFDLEKLVREHKLRVISLRPLDLSVDETLLELQAAVAEIDARRLVIDSLTGFEIALAPAFREDFKESLYRMLGALTGAGVTILMTIEITENWTELTFSPHQVSFLTEDILILRYAEIDGHLRKLLAIAKMRRSGHATELFEFAIGDSGMFIKGPLTMYRGLLTGEPKLELPGMPAYPGLTDQELSVFEVLMRAREATAEVLASAVGLERDQLGRVLDRLVSLNYAVKVPAQGKTMFRPLARPLGG
jgi:circadian clock protein KaiC